MAQGGSQLDFHILQDLKQRFPEIPEGVVSQCLLQNNNNLDLCCHLLAQESNRYLYGEFHHSPEDGRRSRNQMLHISLGYPGSEASKANGGGRSLVHSTSDSHIEPQRPSYPEPLSAPANIAPSPGYNPFFMNDQSRSASTPTPPPTMQGMSPTYSPVPRYTMNPITVTLSQSIPTVPQALQIPPGHYANSSNTPLYIRPSPSQSPQPSPWSASGASVYQHQQSPYSTPTYGSPYSSPQHQVQPQSQPQPQPQHQQYVFLPISSPTIPSMPYHHQQQPQQQPAVYRPYNKNPLKNQIEITLEGPRPRSNSPVHNPHPQGALYMATSPSPSSPSRGITMTGPTGPASFHPGMYLQHQGPARPRPASSPQPGQSAYTFKIKVSPGGQAQRPPSSPPVAEAESLLNIVDHGEHNAAPAPILPISALPGNIASQFHQMPRRSSSGSDDYAYTQALLLHQRARMERLLKELLLEKQKLEHLKSDVNNMEYDALQRRFRRVNSSSLIPRPEEMTRLRSLNRQLQIDIDCTLKETDLLQSRGKFDPKAMNNFYDNIQPGPVVPPKPVRKDAEQIPKPVQGPQRDEDFEGAQWNCESCTFLNHPALNRCEQCEMPRYT
ncbi:TGF-beta-activated kinase 1 and MAP3K7-binding protein 3 isoform X1 [Labrus bergylta]|uniref:TGF-beta activated kinase 1 (MAP3K7) binding protein 3 n=1 Tax=Labrus bergylta TaxID=56723 RepID=A0A3Q3EDV8_9LABR|nr:TGF-beta-activated kinase 1 and MAP3K7-binding protein 3 isoform X1 [Labrus bergylta]XP_020494615.1 TGF-beta-activated kinase 1 and MAP3K7-binding protein 3 isoform X1 [Labrus bergylta]XP_020494616.1 TGF-beta-activated kinase 1 and MAP3K7-binding protein 3 isoform X1 [Labrus bergylta]XP_020494617.1 TGF-beta-activated kinase 1 and MAP3K7-binding protein 3 isoform X1 [Labrus bergylta]XP_020494618.1 TGF-beta-activated kinase 1 and MAP3K7-binding protein 3 isoform X1 [Labrus bergylta]